MDSAACGGGRPQPSWYGAGVLVRKDVVGEGSDVSASRRSPAQRRKRRLWRGILAGLASIAAVVAVGLPLYVFPPVSSPEPPDVVFVMGPPDQWRLDWAQQLLAEGTAGALMISTPDPDTGGLCGADEPYPVECARPEPFTTRGEARWLRSEMVARGWSRAIVITVTPHVSRTRVVFDRCIPSGVQVVGRSTGLNLAKWAYQYLYQTAGFIKVALNPGC
jgi:hypothetical protein